MPKTAMAYPASISSATDRNAAAISASWTFDWRNLISEIKFFVRIRVFVSEGLVVRLREVPSIGVWLREHRFG